MRTFDATLLNSIANDPTVRLMLGGEGEINLSMPLEDPRNFAFVNDDGGFFVMRRMDTIWEVHTIFRPGNIRSVLDLAFQAQDFMFSATPCTELITIVPDDNRGAGILAHKGNFRQTDRVIEWKPGVGATVMSFHIDSWARVCLGVPQLGRAFYNQLEQAKVARGKHFTFLKDEEVFHRMLGVMLHLAMANNVAKGVDLFNKWSLSRGGLSCALYSVQPVVIDIVDAIIGLENGEWRMMLCR